MNTQQNDLSFVDPDGFKKADETLKYGEFHTEQKCCETCECEEDCPFAGGSKHCAIPKCKCHTEQKGWRERFSKTKFARGGGSCFECCDYEGMYTDMEAFIERTLQTQREEMVKFIKSGRIALANIGTTERPEYIFHIPEKVLDDALIKDTPPLKAKE